MYCSIFLIFTIKSSESVGTLETEKRRGFLIIIICRLYAQEHSARSTSFSEDMVLIDDDDPQLFRRNGIIAAFDSL